MKARHSLRRIWAAIFMVIAALLSGCVTEVTAPARLCSYLPEPAYAMDDRRPATQEAALRECEVEHYVAERYLALGYEVVAATALPSGDIMDWVLAQSVPGSDQPPPPPISLDGLHLPPGVQLGKTELQMYPERRGPVDTIGFHRPTFPAYVNGETEASSLEELLQQGTEQPGKVFAPTDRLHAGYKLERTNHGASTVVNAFGGIIEPGTFSLSEMAISCDGPNPSTTYEQIGIAASRDNVNYYHKDSATRVQVEYIAAGDDKSQSGWHGANVPKLAFISRPYSNAHPGDRISESVVGGWQFEHLFTMMLWEGNWWLGYNEEWLGYYPFYLFDEILGSACWLYWYGEVYSPGASQGATWTRTDMGSGEFPEKGWPYAAYFRRMSYFDQENVTHLLFKATLKSVSHPDNDKCYRTGELLPSLNVAGDYAFPFGGPGNDPAKAPLCH